MSDQGEFPAIDLSVYPPAVALLLAQKDDPEHPAFVDRLASFYNILFFLTSKQGITATVAKPPLTKAIDQHADHYPIAAAKPSCISSSCPPPLTTPLTKHILEIEHTKDALKSWLQKWECEILPDSLFIMVSMLFAWVNPLDLIAVLQMEVTLFNKAIANLCEEFNTKCHPSPAPLPKYTSTISACQTPHLDEFEGFRLPTAAHLKCQQWLSMSSEFLVDFLQIQGIPQLYKNILRPNDRFLLLPFLMKSWVDNITYHTYISTSSADCADTKLLGIGIGNSLKAKNEKTLDVLKSDFHILELKKHHTQAEVEMFSEAISCTMGPRLTENGELADFLEVSY
ncbi:hypothetical protein BDR06DRAFT_978072 [Suillus hirtellus]|nr:hypothetical protein BDR06DRAFT_978072 [Suillus hirtellus]